MTQDQEVQKNIQEIRKKLDLIKKKSGEIKVILPTAPGKSMQRNFNEIIKILDKMEEK